jgi:glycerol-3-phosphate dehydrogenase
MRRDFSLLNENAYDLLVCGGGIYGAWVAYDAALRGLRVAIVEQGDWGSATSSASSKLIHGGLRYLESLDLNVVKKSLTERDMLLKAAPHCVRPLRFGVPVYDDSRVGAFSLKAGLTLYDFLAGDLASDMAHRHFDRKRFLEHFPFLNAAGLKGGFTYADAQTDDARMVLELIDGAMSHGAICMNYCRMTGLIEEEGQAVGAWVQDRLHDASGKIHARQIVNAMGHWITEEDGSLCRLTKGVHIVLPGSGINEALLLTAPSDGRVFFIIPWYGRTLIGTTDTDYHGDLNNVTVEANDVAYLLEAANHYLNKAWRLDDVIGSYAGLRALRHSKKAASPSAVSRGWKLETASNGVHYSIGGKLTSAREDAASIMDVVCRRLGVEVPCSTWGKAFPWAPGEDHGAKFRDMSTRARQAGADPECAEWLVRRHGTRAEQIIAGMADNPDLAKRISHELPFTYADLLFCARYEMVVHLDDLLRRRLPLLILATLGEHELRRLAGLVAPMLGWDEAAIEQEVRQCMKQQQRTSP